MSIFDPRPDMTGLSNELKETLGTEKFDVLYETRVKTLDTSSVKSLAHTFTGSRASTREKALQLIKTRQQNILNSIRKRQATGGRIAG